jgi:hypothetical protein
MIVGRCLIFLFAACSLVHGQAGCGRDRWPVKTLTDLDKERVSLSPVSTSVAKLVGFSAPSRPYPQNNRIGPQEFVVYRVRARLLITLLHPSDSDLHLLLADPDTLTAQMIAEIPAPECAEGSGHEDEFRRARAIARKLPFDSLVEIVGVGFFDSNQDLSVGAKNGFELHPVLSVKVLSTPLRHRPQPARLDVGPLANQPRVLHF